ncbi:uncharacterized protein ACRADG_000659 isoform 1-T2 [Cochliomyia hominivorax]
MNGCTQKQSKRGGSYYFKLLEDERKRANKLKEDEMLATTENPRIKFQEETFDICKELRRCKLGDMLEEKRRQQLRANSQQLRQLEKQLQTALISKQLREQRENLARNREEELCKKREEDKKLAAEFEFIRNTLKQEEVEEKRKKETFRNTLKSQIGDLHEKRRKEFEEVIKDKEQMEKLLMRIQAEDMAERNAAKLVQERYRKEIEESCHNRDQQRQLEKQRDNEDIDRNLAYQKECDYLHSQIVAERKRIQKEKEELSEQIGQQLAKIHQEKQTRENILLSLLVEERKAKEEERYRDSLIKKNKEREKLRIELDNYREEIKLRKEREFKEEEERFRLEQLRYLAKRDKLDQLSDEKRRRKKLEHSKALREMVELKRIQKANELAERVLDFEKLLTGEKQRDQLIEDERIRMLKAVPKELLSYLPPGVLKSSDKEFLTLPI